jgi:hypothetical protein
MSYNTIRDITEEDELQRDTQQCELLKHRPTSSFNTIQDITEDDDLHRDTEQCKLFKYRPARQAT